MALTKPSWLRRALDLLNWDIFTWKVYIGDAVENGIDWALEWINWGIDKAAEALNWARDAWDKATGLWNDLVTRINQALEPVRNWIDTWKSRLAEWWSGVSTQVLAWIEAAKDWANDRIEDARRLIDRIDIAWENFRRDTLPRLLDPAWVRSFFGAGIASIADWWATKAPWVRDTVETTVAPVRDEVNKHTTWLDLVKDFFSDPQQFIYDLLMKIFERFW